MPHLRFAREDDRRGTANTFLARSTPVIRLNAEFLVIRTRPNRLGLCHMHAFDQPSAKLLDVFQIKGQPAGVASGF